MCNKQITISWAESAIQSATGFVYSDKFFEPFNKESTRSEIIDELFKRDIVVWPDTKRGAFLFKKDDPRLYKLSRNEVQVGAWVESSNVLLLPTIELMHP